NHIVIREGTILGKHPNLFRQFRLFARGDATGYVFGLKRGVGVFWFRLGLTFAVVVTNDFPLRCGDRVPRIAIGLRVDQHAQLGRGHLVEGILTRAANLAGITLDWVLGVDRDIFIGVFVEVLERPGLGRTHIARVWLIVP